MRQLFLRPWPRVTLLVATLAVAGLACTKSADVNATTPATTASPSTTVPTVTTALATDTAPTGPALPATSTVPGATTTTTTAPSGAPSTAPEPSTSAVPPSTTPEVKAFCAKSTEVDRETSSGDPEAPDFLAKQKIAYQQLTDLAPEQIKADMQALNAVVQKAKTMADTSALSTDPLLGAALDRVTKFVGANCT